jgi:nucleoside-diphosphate-sugar epimerase
VNVLLTGGSGFIGRYVHNALMGAGHKVCMLDLVEPSWDAAPARIIVGDIRDPFTVRRALAGCDAVLHLAGAHHDFGIARETFFSVNEMGAQVLSAAASEAGLKNICFFSTVAVYGATPEPRHEAAPTLPISPYGESKLLAERVFQRWTQAGDSRRCLVVRPTVVFGPGNFANMYTLIRLVDSGLFLRVGPGDNVKSLAYVENLVDGVLYLWQKPAENAFEIFNYVDKPDLDTRRLLGVIYHALGRQPPVLHLPLSLALVGALLFDLMIKISGRNLPISTARIRKMSAQTKFESDKIRQAGFQPKMTLIDGIDRMTRWYLSEGRYHSAERQLPPLALRSGALAGRRGMRAGDEA